MWGLWRIHGSLTSGWSWPFCFIVFNCFKRNDLMRQMNSYKLTVTSVPMMIVDQPVWSEDHLAARQHCTCGFSGAAMNMKVMYPTSGDGANHPRHQWWHSFPAAFLVEILLESAEYVCSQFYDICRYAKGRRFCMTFGIRISQKAMTSHLSGSQRALMCNRFGGSTIKVNLWLVKLWWPLDGDDLLHREHSQRCLKSGPWHLSTKRIVPQLSADQRHKCPKSALGKGLSATVMVRCCCCCCCWILRLHVLKVYPKLDPFHWVI